MKVMRAVSVLVAYALAAGCSSGDKQRPPGFDLLRASQDLKRGPYVQLATADSILVVWQTYSNTIGVLEYGITAEFGTRLQTGGLGRTHSLSLTGLQPNTYYYYRVLDGDAPLSQTVRFHTSSGPADTDFRFVVFGDSGSGERDMYEVANLVNNSNAEFGLHTGDIVYVYGEEELYDPRFFYPYAPFLAENVLYMSIGNHDMLTDGGAPYFNNFYLPRNDWQNTENYYSFDYGHAHFVALDTELSTQPDSNQRRWLIQDLSRNAQPWTFVFFHKPPYTAGFLDEGKGPIPLDTASLRANVVPLFELYGVDVVFSGHSHSYERTFPILQNQVIDQGQEPNYTNPSGPVYVITGGGGASLLGLNSSPLNARESLSHHIVEVSVSGDQLIGRVIEPSGAVIDEFSITR
jgi:predicted phosphodiesterase